MCVGGRECVWEGEIVRVGGRDSACVRELVCGRESVCL